jgi:6-phosphofructokinase 1
MNTIIDELLIENPNINDSTTNLYESLGLMTIRSSKAIKIISTANSKITRFSDAIYISIKNTLYNKLKASRALNQAQGNSYVLQDNLGNRIVIEMFKKKRNIRIGILTSGGDAPGMNSAVKSIVRLSLKNEMTIFGIYRGYEGMIRGDIRKLGWNSETKESGQGGTTLLSVRCKKFYTREGRKEAAYNLYVRGINSLAILGGDGSITGAVTLKNEFRELCMELDKEGRFDEIKRNCNMQESSTSSNNKGLVDLLKDNIKREIRNKENFQKAKHEKAEIEDSHKNDESSKNSSLSIENLNDILSEFSDDESSENFMMQSEQFYDLKIVAIPCTIDNDIHGTDLSLGADTALHRISEVVDRLITTMRSHKRTFVLECMGNKAGWLALMSAFANNADFVMIPEVYMKDWKEQMILTVKTAYNNHKPNIFVFISEGIVDENGERITLNDVEKVIRDAGMDVRSLKIGHIQRGGTTSAQDRIIGTLSGIKAVEYFMSDETESKLVALKNDKYELISLESVIEENNKIEQYIKNSMLENVFLSRGLLFNRIYTCFEKHRKLKVAKYYVDHLYPREDKISRIHAINEQKFIEDISDRRVIDNLRNFDISKLEATKDGSRIAILTDGIRVPGMNTILNTLVQYGICRNLEIFYFLDGYDGVEALRVRKANIFEFSKSANDGGSALGTSNSKELDTDMLNRKLSEMKIDHLIVIGGARNLKIVKAIKNSFLIPTSSKNNIPGTSKSIGCDTSLNIIALATDSCLLSAYSMKKTIMIVETGGDNCGYLSIMGGIAAGAFDIFYPEDCSIERVVNIKKRLNDLFKRQKRHSIVLLRNENTFDKMSTDSLCKILSSDTKFKSYFSILGHFQKGLSPSPIDRINSNLIAIETLNSAFEGKESGVIGMVGFMPAYAPIDRVLEDYDADKDTVKNPEWLKLADVCSFLE